MKILKMTKPLLLTVLCFVIADSLMAQENSCLQKVYVGGVHVGTIPNGEYYHFQNNMFPLIGVKTAFPMLSGTLNSCLIHDFQNAGAHLWWEKNLSILKFNIGYLGRPITILNRPEPVSASGNFEPPPKAVIPGSAFGARTKVKFDRINNESMFGLYQTDKNSVEFNYGIQQNINWSIFEKISVSGYQGKSVNGIAINAKLKKTSLMFFKGVDVNDVVTYSGFVHYSLIENAGPFLAIVNKNDEWTVVRLGAFKTFSEQVGNTKINYLLGAGYHYSETEPNSFNFYVQIWWGK